MTTECRGHDGRESGERRGQQGGKEKQMRGNNHRKGGGRGGENSETNECGEFGVQDGWGKTRE